MITKVRPSGIRAISKAVRNPLPFVVKAYCLTGLG
ncbi:hypothetical protein V1282_006504 [Nitrobacteraceae bacterium AZCC 2146]